MSLAVSLRFSDVLKLRKCIRRGRRGTSWQSGQECEVWSVKIWSGECEVWSAECEVWSGECEVWSVKLGV